jgi:hypothetical protein
MTGQTDKVNIVQHDAPSQTLRPQGPEEHRGQLVQLPPNLEPNRICPARISFARPAGSTLQAERKLIMPAQERSFRTSCRGIG